MMALFWRVFLAASLWGGLAWGEELEVCSEEPSGLIEETSVGWHALLPEVVFGVDYRETLDLGEEQRADGYRMAHGAAARYGYHYDDRFTRFTVGLRWTGTGSSTREVTRYESRRGGYCERYWQLEGQMAGSLKEAIGLWSERARFRALLSRGGRK